jgi:hypothetical protein
MIAMALEAFPAGVSPSVCLFENSNRLVSLLDIVDRFRLLQFADVVKTLSEAQHRCHVFRLDPAGAAQVDLPWIKRIVEDVDRHCKVAGFDDAAWLAHGLALRCITPDLATLATHLYHLQEAVLSDARKHAFVNIRSELAQYVEQDNLFGQKVSMHFPSAAPDIKDAGNCLSVGCSTAAVFHLMRTVEHGLRALAFDRRVKLIKGPIELATWEEIIKKIELAEQAIQGYPKTLAREAQYEFYHGAMMEFRRFKNKFRNQVMHTRDEYDQDEARSAFTHVKAFMQILAGKISETKRTPVIWKRV